MTEMIKNTDNGTDVTINLNKALIYLSRALDFSQQGILQHHKRVALMALNIGRASGMTEEELLNLFKAAIIHDIGAVDWEQRLTLSQFEIVNPWEHCLKGTELVSGLNLFRDTRDIILSHHDKWAGGNRSGLRKNRIPLESRIIHLADRLDILINSDVNILCQRLDILKEIQNYSGIFFDPDLVDILSNLAINESLWLDMVSPWIFDRLIDIVPSREFFQMEDIMDMARLYARGVDAKSPFTFMHSRGVANVAAYLGNIMGLPLEDRKNLKLAGLLHDIGKLSIPEGIIVKSQPLTKEEIELIRQHTYYTYWWLKPVFTSGNVAEWAAFHHERINGTGYPFHKKAHELDLQSRLMAVADVYTALREDRPYRTSISPQKAEAILKNQAKEGALDGELVEALYSEKEALNDYWEDLYVQVKKEKKEWR